MREDGGCNGSDGLLELNVLGHDGGCNGYDGFQGVKCVREGRWLKWL